MHGTSFVKAIDKYEKALNEISSWKTELTGGLIVDALIWRDIVQQEVDFFSKTTDDLSIEEKEYLEFLLKRVEQLDLFLREETPRILSSNTLNNLRNESSTGWWWHLDKESDIQ